ncbi:transcriptional regulator, TetR family [Salipiger thiooxidans]|uniref:Transcriptional regulator, TetR family n=1 Tax=Salipiger thiooxidans TaxID=282683 RepID=A0A1G7E5H3_9RHOB|nr:TetR/AcrR family transcriptional regulator [Salipiger thiooxidans]SDE58927.1 transcriptional regulator, TetR family [Salipiger thiooxidans]
MAERLTRKERNAMTRQSLLGAAGLLFARDGYASTSVGAIAAQAGFTKGAFYANFPSKAAICLEVFETTGRASLDRLIEGIEAAPDRTAIEALLVDWAGSRRNGGLWPLTLLEFARLAEREGASVEDMRVVLRRHWALLGMVVLRRIPADTDADTLGALLHEIAYAPAMTFVGQPDAADLMRLFLEGFARDGESRR